MKEIKLKINKEEFKKKLGIKDGERGLRGLQGLRGPQGLSGKDGERGPQGLRGLQGPKGSDGVDGKDVDEKKILRELTKKLPDLKDTMNQYGAVISGSAKMTILNNGERLSEHVLNLNFGPGLTASYSNGTILVSANASGSILTATGAINDSNLSFTFTQQPSVLIVNGSTYQQTGGSITWTWTSATLTATLSAAVGTNGSIFGMI